MLSLSVAQNENEDTTMLSLSVAQNENEDTTMLSHSVAYNSPIKQAQGVQFGPDYFSIPSVQFRGFR